MEDEAVVSEQNAPISDPEVRLTQGQINSIVKSAKLETAEKVRKELETRHVEELSRLKNQGQAPIQDNMSSIEDRVVNRLMAEAKKHEDAEAKRYHEELEQKQLEEANKLVAKYQSKMSLGKDKFDDFEEIMGDFVPQAFPQLVFLATQEENTPEVMYELAKNPQKLAAMHTLAMTHPALAEKEMKRLAASITQNQQAQAQNVSAQAPLSRLKSSQSTGVDSGKMSVADFKNADWLRPTR